MHAHILHHRACWVFAQMCSWGPPDVHLGELGLDEALAVGTLCRGASLDAANLVAVPEQQHGPAVQLDLLANACAPQKKIGHASAQSCKSQHELDIAAGSRGAVHQQRPTLWQFLWRAYWHPVTSILSSGALHRLLGHLCRAKARFQSTLTLNKIPSSAGSQRTSRRSAGHKQAPAAVGALKRGPGHARCRDDWKQHLGPGGAGAHCLGVAAGSEGGHFAC